MFRIFSLVALAAGIFGAWCPLDEAKLPIDEAYDGSGIVALGRISVVTEADGSILYTMKPLVLHKGCWSNVETITLNGFPMSCEGGKKFVPQEGSLYIVMGYSSVPTYLNVEWIQSRRNTSIEQMRWLTHQPQMCGKNTVCPHGKTPLSCNLEACSGAETWCPEVLTERTLCMPNPCDNCKPHIFSEYGNRMCDAKIKSLQRNMSPATATAAECPNGAAANCKKTVCRKLKEIKKQVKEQGCKDADTIVACIPDKCHACRPQLLNTAGEEVCALQTACTDASFVTFFDPNSLHRQCPVGMPVGWGYQRNKPQSCVGKYGCGSQQTGLFKSPEDCRAQCVCRSLQPVKLGACKQFIGWGLNDNNKCVQIRGCKKTDAAVVAPFIHASLPDCKRQCGNLPQLTFPTSSPTRSPTLQPTYKPTVAATASPVAQPSVFVVPELEAKTQAPSVLPPAAPPSPSPTAPTAAAAEEEGQGERGEGGEGGKGGEGGEDNFFNNVTRLAIYDFDQTLASVHVFELLKSGGKDFLLDSIARGLVDVTLAFGGAERLAAVDRHLSYIFNTPNIFIYIITYGLTPVVWECLKLAKLDKYFQLDRIYGAKSPELIEANFDKFKIIANLNSFHQVPWQQTVYIDDSYTNIEPVYLRDLAETIYVQDKEGMTLEQMQQMEKLLTGDVFSSTPFPTAKHPTLEERAIAIGRSDLLSNPSAMFPISPGRNAIPTLGRPTMSTPNNGFGAGTQIGFGGGLGQGNAFGGSWSGSGIGGFGSPFGR
mmetsp:Transcript_31239/g.60895  ORF Transcript_31239/g.60895 Transcript_31239/m.60895 type:complete len:766 (+) Transcript_31239:43-2340(+)